MKHFFLQILVDRMIFYYFTLQFINPLDAQIYFLWSIKWLLIHSLFPRTLKNKIGKIIKKIFLNTGEFRRHPTLKGTKMIKLIKPLGPSITFLSAIKFWAAGFEPAHSANRTTDVFIHYTTSWIADISSSKYSLQQFNCNKNTPNEMN